MTPGARPVGGDIRALTGLRGVAACYVVAYHFFYYLVTETPSARSIKPLLLHGYMAVDLFFVLSGFVLALTYGRAFAGKFSGGAYAGFLLKRLGRVYPLFLMVTLIQVALINGGLVPDAPPDATVLVSNLLMVHAWGFAEGIVGTTWSISTELAAYLIFPALVACVLTSRRGWAVVAGVVSLGCLMLVATRGSAAVHQMMGDQESRNGPLDVYIGTTLYPLLRCFAGFTLGMLAYRASRASPVRRVAGLPFAGDLACVAVLTLLAVPASAGVDVAVVVAFVALVIALPAERSVAARVLGSRAVHWLGAVSYSIYLLHRPVSEVARGPIADALAAMHAPHPYTLAGVPTVALVLGLSAATYYGVERPARDAVRRLSGMRRGTPIAKAAAP